MSVDVRAEFQEGERIVFTARDRSTVNVRRAAADGPIGFNSIELLLIAFGNCSLGTLMGQPALAEASVGRVTAEISGEMEENPPRLVRVVSNVRIESADPAALLSKLSGLEDATGQCPVCNSIRAEKQINISVIPLTAGNSVDAVAVDGPSGSCEVATR